LFYCFSQADRHELFKTLALMKEAANYASQAVTASGDKNECGILIGDIIDPDGSTRKLDLFEPWTPLIFLIQGQHTPFSLIVHKINKTPANRLGGKAVYDFDANQFSLTYLETYSEDGQKIFASNDINNNNSTQVNMPGDEE